MIRQQLNHESMEVRKIGETKVVWSPIRMDNNRLAKKFWKQRSKGRRREGTVKKTKGIKNMWSEKLEEMDAGMKQVSSTCR